MKTKKIKMDENKEFFPELRLNFDDKNSWGDGDWINEPDIKYFRYKGYHCFIVRNEGGGNLNGYVLVKTGSKYDHDDYMEMDLDVHGGLTFSNFYLPWATVKPDNWPVEIETEVHRILGFDCGHYNDLRPKAEKVMENSRDVFPELKKLHAKYKKSLIFDEYFNRTYKNMEYVEKELHQLVDQIIKAEAP